MPRICEGPSEVHAGQKKPGKRSIRRFRLSLACSVACLGVAGRRACRWMHRSSRNDCRQPRHHRNAQRPHERLDGALSIGASFFMRNTQHYNFSFQALPWLGGGSFRYSGLSHYSASDFPGLLRPQFRLQGAACGMKPISSRPWRWASTTSSGPAFTGVRVSGRLPNSLGDFDTNAGHWLGTRWARPGCSAIRFRFDLAIFTDPTVPAPLSKRQAARISTSSFTGRTAGLFGGVVWNTPIVDGPSANCGIQQRQIHHRDNWYWRSTNTFRPRNQFNFGVSYQVSPAWRCWPSTGFNGTSIGGNITFQLDPTTVASPERIGDPALPPLRIRTPEEQQQALNQLLQMHNPWKLIAWRPKFGSGATATPWSTLPCWSQTSAPGDDQ